MAIRSLPDVADGSSIFVDTNILIYHLLDDELYGESCRDFLKRVETRSLTAFTSPIVASETLFIYLRAWVIQNKRIAPKRVLRYLKRHRAVLQEIDFQKPLDLLGLLRVLPITSDTMKTSHDLMTRYQLLPADAIQAAQIQRYHLTALATRDDDFDHVGGLDIYKP
jgi:predicted nucleic acid-binding protein